MMRDNIVYLNARQAHDTIDDRALIAHMRRVTEWICFPYGWWTEASGAHVIYDRKYRPICRKHTDGRVEIVPSDTWIIFESSRHFYCSPDTPYTCPEARDRVLGVVYRLGLADEIKRRRSLDRRGLLPRAPWGGRAVR
jgi:hypothetical protein